MEILWEKSAVALSKDSLSLELVVLIRSTVECDSFVWIVWHSLKMGVVALLFNLEFETNTLSISVI